MTTNLKLIITTNLKLIITKQKHSDYVNYGVFVINNVFDFSVVFD